MCSKSSCFLVKQKGLARVFSREPNNLAQIHSFRYSGLVNDKSVGIQADASGKGVVVSTRKTKVAPNKIAGSRSEQLIKKGGPRHKAGSVAKIVGKRGYRSDLLKGEYTLDGPYGGCSGGSKRQEWHSARTHLECAKPKRCAL